MTNMKEIAKEAEKFQDLQEVVKELRNVQSAKTRMKKQKERKDYNDKMTKILQREQILKEVRDFLTTPKITTTRMTLADIDKLTYDETIKAIKSIQSKKCNTQYDLVKDEYNSACEIEQMLLKHKMSIKPIDDNCVKKSQINDVMHEIENLENINKDDMIRLLKSLM